MAIAMICIYFLIKLFLLEEFWLMEREINLTIFLISYSSKWLCNMQHQ